MARVLLGTALLVALWFTWSRTVGSAGGEGPVSKGSAPARTTRVFEDVTAQSGVSFTSNPHPSPYFFPEIMGSGCALIDFDRDGDLDLYLIAISRDESATAVDSPGSRNRLFRNDGTGHFTDVSDGSGVDVSVVGMGAAAGDVNNDGWPDLYVSCYGADWLFLNRGDETFVDATDDAGIDNPAWGTSCAFVDYDRDGWLDIVVTNYVDYDATHRCTTPGGQADYCNPKSLRPVAARLFHNEGGQLASDSGASATSGVRPVRFRDATLESKIGLEPGPGLGVVAADFNGDRWPDFFVANDGASNFLWINCRDGTFENEAILRGVANDPLGRPQANMGIALGDVNGDGEIDLFVTHLAGETHSLYVARGAGSYDDANAAAGLGMSGLPFTGFGAAFLDVDHDGGLDLAVANGRVRRQEWGATATRLTNSSDGGNFWTSYAERNQLFLNDGRGTFREMAPADDSFASTTGVWRGLACGDIDNDGDLDVIITNAGGAAAIFRNEADKRGRWLQVRCVEPQYGGRDACGADVRVMAGNREWRRVVNPGSSYLTSGDPRAHFGLGDVEAIDRILIVWPDGSEERFAGVPVDQLMTLEHGRGEAP